MPDLFNPDVEFTPADKLKSVERELAYRRRVYERLKAAGKIRPALADREIAVMEAIAADYRKQV
jgi:hypothetical protein